MKAGIIGAGIGGLTAGYHLAQEGHQVVIFDKKTQVGGLATSFRKPGWSWPLERYPHHLFTSDQAAKQLIQNLNLTNKLFFPRPKTSVFFQGKISQLDSPGSIFTSPHFSLPEKLRIAISTGWLKMTPFWQTLEKTTAVAWLNRYYGQSATQKLWLPLLEGKFGSQTKQITMSWLWARIKKRSVRLGYLNGGFQILIDRLVHEIKAQKGQIKLKHPITNLKQLQSQFDCLVVTTPTSEFLKIAPGLTKNDRQKYHLPEMIGAVCLVLELKKQFLTDNTYWLNINETDFPFVFVDEHTNFVPKKHYADHYLLYVGGYYPQNHRYFKTKKEKIFKEWRPFLKKINPNYNFRRLTLDYSLFTDRYAQPVVPINYSQLIPPHQTPIPGVYLANLQQIYPWDRGINYSIKLGEKIAKLVINDCRKT